MSGLQSQSGWLHRPPPGAASTWKGIPMIKRTSTHRSRALPSTLVAGLLMLVLAGPRVFAADRDDSDDRDSRIVSTYFQNFHLYSGIFLRRLADNGVAPKLDILAHAFV